MSMSHSIASRLLLSHETKISVKEVLIIHHDDGIYYFSMHAYTGIMKESNLLYIFVGATLSEPHINSTAMCEFYIIILLLLWYIGHAKLYPSDALWT